MAADELVPLPECPPDAPFEDDLVLDLILAARRSATGFARRRGCEVTIDVMPDARSPDGWFATLVVPGVGLVGNRVPVAAAFVGRLLYGWGVEPGSAAWWPDRTARAVARNPALCDDPVGAAGLAPATPSRNDGQKH